MSEKPFYVEMHCPTCGHLLLRKVVERDCKTWGTGVKCDECNIRWAVHVVLPVEHRMTVTQEDL